MNVQRILASLTFLIMACNSSALFAQDVENEVQTRTKIDLKFKPLKKVKFTLSPELRFDDAFTLDKFLLEGELEFKASKLVTLGASYGLVGNVRDEKDTEYSSRYAFSTTLKKELNRFEPSLRLMYSNYADDDITDKNFMKYKAGLRYDIANCKITPEVSAQFYHDLSNGGIHKTRYSLGADYKIMKNNYVSAAYKLDYYNKEYLNRHIICIGYKIKF